MEIRRDNVSYLLKEIGVTPSKNNGQNFLVDPQVSKTIVDYLNTSKDERILEVGPGLGSLTHFLNKDSKIDVVDIDEKLCDFLSYIYEKEGVNAIHNDALKTQVDKYEKIISNVPYSITSELIEYLLLNGENCKRFVLMVQDEVFFRLAATEGKDYCPLGILISLKGKLQRRQTIKPNAFYPAPKCKSIVFTIDINPKYDHETCKEIYKFVKTLFLNRRKTILNNMQNIVSKEEALRILNLVNINPMFRPEQLTVQDFCNIFFSLKNR